MKRSNPDLTSNPLEIREIVFGSPEYEDEILLRSAILREPLGLRFTPEELSQDTNDIHLGAFSGAELVGCLILSRKTEELMRMRQVAARESGRGIGRKLVERAEAVTRDAGARHMILNAREGAVEFYKRLGYIVQSGPVIEVSIPHFRMEKSLGR